MHHSIEELNAVNSYHHISEPLLQWIGIGLPASLIVSDSGVTVPIIAVIIHLNASFIHLPMRVSFGPLRAVFCDNRFHWIHHSLETRHFDGNFGAFTTLWDRFFSTAWFPIDAEWPDIGLAGVG